MTALIVIVALVALVVLLNLKTSRPDGEYLGRIHPYRKLMLYIMPGRNESVVYYDDQVRVDRLLEYIEKARQRFHTDVTHCIVGAVANGMRENPSMNRFAVGHRLYQRKGIWITFSMKRQKLGRKAKLAVVKREVPETQTFYELVTSLNETIKVERSDAKTYMDKEVGLLSRIPRPVLRLGVKALKLLDYYNLLPGSFIVNDGMYTSLFAANLGSVGMRAGFHHLYEWGTCPLFMMIGKIEERPVVRDGQLTVERVMPVRFTYDERIDDGLNAGYGIATMVRTLEHPFELLGCLAPDGSDDHPIGQPPAHKALPAAAATYMPAASAEPDQPLSAS
jgi:hypothetical protein